VPIVLKSGSLNLLEHSGPVQACNGIALLIQSFVKPMVFLAIWGKKLLLIKFFPVFGTPALW